MATRAIRPLHAFAIGAAASGVVVAAFTNDWACAAIGAAIIGGVATLTVGAIANKRGARPRVTWALVTAAAVAVAFGQWARVEMTLRRDAWVGVFGRLPAGRVHGPYDVRRFYVGGPGDRLTLIRFTADPADVAAWVAALPPSSDDPLEFVRDGQTRWPQFWERFAGEAIRHGAPGWSSPPTMHEPLAYTSTTMPGNSGSAITTRTIVWDAATGETFVVFTEG